MVQGLLKVSVFEVSFSEFGVSSDKNEEILFVDVYEDFAEGKLLDSDLDDTVLVLRECEFVQSLVPLHYETLSD